VQTAKLVDVRFSARRPEPAGGAVSDAMVIRWLDIALALAALIFVAPLMVVIGVCIWVQDGGPALFAHTRVGKGGRRFKCLKFRTMVVGAETRLQTLLAADPAARREWEADHKLRRDPRITALGRFLRKSSLDELPQLLNVLAGEMSLVGPRPIVESEVSRYGRWYHHYCSATPGITGLWQVSGRNNVSYRRRVALDVLYTKNASLPLYVAILFRTVPALLQSKGCY